jgi:hypothetical protein
MHAQVRTEWLDVVAHEAGMLIAELDRHPRARRLFQGTIDLTGYASFLVQTYHYVRWTTPLLRRAGWRMRKLGKAPDLASFLFQRAVEERGRQERLLADLQNLGWSAEQVKHTQVCHAVAAYAAWNRFTSEVGSPTALLGSAYVLEFLAVHRAPMVVESLLARRVIPSIHEALSFLRGHGGVEEEPMAGLVSALRVLTEPEEQSAVLLSARTTRALYRGIFHELEIPVT